MGDTLGTFAMLPISGCDNKKVVPDNWTVKYR